MIDFLIRFQVCRIMIELNWIEFQSDQMLIYSIENKSNKNINLLISK